MVLSADVGSKMYGTEWRGSREPVGWTATGSSLQPAQTGPGSEHVCAQAEVGPPRPSPTIFTVLVPCSSMATFVR